MQIKSQFPRQSSPPPRAEKPQAPTSHEVGGLEDAYEKSSNSGWIGLGAASLAVLGVATVATGVVAQPAQAAELECAGGRHAAELSAFPPCTRLTDR